MSGQGAPEVRPVDASGLTLGIVATTWHPELTDSLLARAIAAAEDSGVPSPTVVRAPGAVELPVVAQALCVRHDAVVALGVVVRGGTPHFEYVAEECAAGIMRVTLDTGVPIVFGVLTTENLEQCIERTGGAEGHKGAEAARTAVEMVTLLRELAATPMVAPSSRTKGS